MQGIRRCIVRFSLPFLLQTKNQKRLVKIQEMMSSEEEKKKTTKQKAVSCFFRSLLLPPMFQLQISAETRSETIETPATELAPAERLSAAHIECGALQSIGQRARRHSVAASVASARRQRQQQQQAAAVHDVVAFDAIVIVR